MIWNYLHWLSTPHQGHGLGAAFRDLLTAYAFGAPLAAAGTRQEFRIPAGHSTRHSTKWPDFALGAPALPGEGGPAAGTTHLLFMDDLAHRRAGDGRKHENLSIYLTHARTLVPPSGGRARLLVLTDTTDAARYGGPGQAASLRARLGADAENPLPDAPSGWRLLPLQTVGAWVAACASAADAAAQPDLRAFADWAQGLGGRR